jgi:hypothetical protein
VTTSGGNGDLLADGDDAAIADLAKALDEVAASTAEQLLDLRARLLAAERRIEELEGQEAPAPRERDVEVARPPLKKRLADKAAARETGRAKSTAELKANLTREQIQAIRDERARGGQAAKQKKR